MSYTAVPTSATSGSTSPSSTVYEIDSPSPSVCPLLPASSHDHGDNVWKVSRGKTRWTTHKRVGVVASAVLGLIILSALSISISKVEVQDKLSTLAWTKEYYNGQKYTTLLTPTATDNATTLDSPYRNPVAPSQWLDFDKNLSIEPFSSTIAASTPSSLIFHCAHANLTLCAQAYRVVFIGPTMRSTAWSESQPLDDRRVEVHFEIRDPGNYTVYAYPEHSTCDQWNHWETRPYFRLAVSGTPASLVVKGEPPKDGVRSCGLEDDLTAGRWVSRRHFSPEHYEPTSPLYEWLQSHLDPTPTRLETIADYRNYGYVFAQYDCKTKHRTFEEYMNVIKPDSLLFLGDSITRDQWCLNYAVEDQTPGVCKFQKWGSIYEKNNKHVPFHRTSDNSSTEMFFEWQPEGNSTQFEEYIASLPKPPSHIFFEIALWITQLDPSPEFYVSRMRPFLETLVRVAPNAKIMTRTTVSQIQAIACYDLRNIQRLVLEPVNAAFVELMREFPSIELIDSYKIYDDRPDASEDGRHWERVEPDPKWSKPEEGAVTAAMTDIIFERWRLEHEREHRL